MLFALSHAADITHIFSLTLLQATEYKAHRKSFWSKLPDSLDIERSWPFLFLTQYKTYLRPIEQNLFTTCV
ncbi:hypothetical protein VITFI_CDS1320 [Vitreoscilla filiformis]|uniref:Uncharacterized protein n=1 Tax=Vitreoscilla filiformis TaxID=63 RepID=A0A221KDJ5_VITFI|nr:hypothetical protein VITFI_CDS1320 [Vitreoscilla filiformis]